MTRFAGIVLAGGRSSRMGSPKAELPWQGEPLVAHVARRLLGCLDGPVVVVQAPGQELPELPAGVEVTRDAREDRGPLEGLAAGLAAVEGRADAAYVSATDVPLLRPELVRLVAGSLDESADAVVPRVGDRMYPLTAAYRTGLLVVVRQLIAAERMRALDLVEAVRVRWLTETELRAVDPTLDSLRNVNTPEDYEAVVREARGR